MSKPTLSNQVATYMTEYYDWWTSHHDEKVYGFVFFSTALLEYGGCTVFTEEGLEQVIHEYQQMEMYQNTAIEELKNDLRWSPCDSPHHIMNEDIGTELSDSLDAISEELYQLNDEPFSQAVKTHYQSIIDGILKFREKRIPLDEKDILVTMLWGDMSPEEMSRFIKACNHKEAAKHYIQDMNL